MKNIKYLLLILFVAFSWTSCDQDKLLTETPKDFLSPENSFTTVVGFEAALIDIHRRMRDYYVAPGDGWNQPSYALRGVDVDVSCYWQTAEQVNDLFNWNTMTAQNGVTANFWSTFYNWIFHANVIIGRADDDVVTWTSDAEKNAIVGEAKFMRAWCYNMLANMFGGVPIILEETSAPKFDFVRASRDQVYQQCKEDLEFATQWMNKEDVQLGGRPPRAAAYHTLAEVNMSLGNYQEAITAASWVINNPAYELMTARYGSYKNFTFSGWDRQGPAEPWGDVYFDLFQEDNFNRSEGNTECIWNGQMDYVIEGGGFIGASQEKHGGNQNYERWLASGEWLVKDINGQRSWLADTLMGRAVWGPMITEYAYQQVWEFKDDFDRDMRNSTYNMKREYVWYNPANPKFGQFMKLEDMLDPVGHGMMLFPTPTKVYSTTHHGLKEQNGELHDNGRTYKDWYYLRLPETILLRAEAYYRNGDNASAAADINMVRNRAQATPVDASDVDLDLILDERARELWFEENRLSTLTRMGKLVEYLNKYNGSVITKGHVLPAHLNLLPIPESEIEKNKDAVLEQNPGY